MTKPTPNQLQKNYKKNSIIGILLLICSLITFIIGLLNFQKPILAVLLFHDVVPNPEKPWEISQENLENLITKFIENDYKFVDPKDFTQLYANGFEGRNIMITFDDGLSNETKAIKELYTKFGIKSACFLLETKVDKPDFMDKETILDLQNNYGTFFGLHGKYHIKYTEQLAQGISLGAITEEAREKINNLIGINIKWLAYPFGAYDSSVLKEIKEKTKIEIAFTIEPGNIETKHNPFTLKRYMYLGNDTESKIDEKTEYSLLPPSEQENGKKLLVISILALLFGLGRLQMAKKAKKTLAEYNQNSL